MPRVLASCLWLGLVVAQSCSSDLSEYEQDVMRGSITYPFAQRTDPLGLDRQRETLVIRARKGDSEYAVELPGAGVDYDVHIPVEELGATSSAQEDRLSKSVGSPVLTDRELIGVMPKLSSQSAPKVALLDRSMGLMPSEKPSQGPSYTLSLARIKRLFEKKRFEYCLIEINNTLAFYPNSARLHKMKGTVLLRLNERDLAAQAWQKALELNPNDATLRSALTALAPSQEPIEERSGSVDAETP